MPFCHLTIKAQRPLHPRRWKCTQVVAEQPTTIGDHIKNRRLKLHLLQRTVAEDLCVHTESLKNWERGVGVPSVRQIPRIIEFLGYDPEPEPETLVRRLAYVRRRLGMTQEDLAKAIDVDPGTILRWEKGEGVPSAKKLERLRELRPASEPAVASSTHDQGSDNLRSAGGPGGVRGD